MTSLSSDSRPIIGRDPPLGAGLLALSILSIALMVLDHRSNYLDTARLWLGAAVTPVYAVVQAPHQAWHWLTSSFSDRNRLREENTELNEELRRARIQLLQFDSLREENQRLRAVRAASAGLGERMLIAEIMQVDINPFRHRVRINKGSADGVFRGQPVLDAFGIFGQVVAVEKFTSTLILVSDTEHAIPVLVNRNGVRSIAVGSGDMSRLILPYLTSESDVSPDDLLVSSGLDGIFPAGYPVATITRVERNPNDTFAVVEARPLAQLDRDREVLLLWPDEPAEQPVEDGAEETPPDPITDAAADAPASADSTADTQSR